MSETGSSLVEHDRYIRSLSKLKDQTERQIIQKMVETRNSMTHNKYLKIVYNDYKTYFDRLVEEKHAQIKTLEAIYAHLNDIMLENLKKHTNKLGNDNIQKDKKEILREIRRIKHDLNIFMKIDAGKRYDIKKGGGGDNQDLPSSSSSSSSDSDSDSDDIPVDSDSETETGNSSSETSNSSETSSSSSSSSSETSSSESDDDD